MFDTGSRDGDERYLEWAKQVKKLGNYSCDLCGRRNASLHSHHKNSWSAFPNERYIVSNGVCICVECHDNFHSSYGLSNNTKEQYEEYKILMKTFQKIARQKIDEERKNSIHSKK